MKVTKAIRKYLQAHAEPEAHAGVDLVAANMPDGFSHAVVVPSYAEADSVLQLLASIPRGPSGPVLVVIVVNEPPNAPANRVRANQATLKQLDAQFPSRAKRDSNGAASRTRRRKRDSDDPTPRMQLRRHPSGAMLVVERTGSVAIPAKQGVGLARKIGLDIALAATVGTDSNVRWFHSTDADAQLPEDYFAAAGRAPEASALLYPFRHRSTNRRAPVLAYEASLRYYVLGLRAAGSPFSFHTIGSAIAVSPHHYAAVRGVPKRNAAEDFYLLSKLHRVGDIAHADAKPIMLSDRASDRVPFGTGPAVAKAATLTNLDTFQTYDPRAFCALRAALQQGTALSALETLRLIRAHSDRYPPCSLRDAIDRALFIDTGWQHDLASLCEALAEQERATASNRESSSDARTSCSEFAQG